ncbi:hypothetical protein V7183_24710 [Bacillus sp. JJ1127]|uniref:hypothetical protein n=1 Tax=Bacillus sp. JJ1127 TaxID=3122952 RepID=UPI0030005FF1
MGVLALSDIAQKVQVNYRKTIVGWYNVYIAETESFVNISPQQFRELLPHISPNTQCGCDELSYAAFENLFWK